MYCWKVYILLTCLLFNHVVYGRKKAKRCNKKPNIVMILADDYGYNDIGYHNPEVLTPCLDELAREGMILESSYVLNTCTPTRHALLTGRYPHRDRMGHEVIFTNKFCSPTNIDFLSQRLKELNYKTLATGKWHLGHCQQQCLPIKFFGLYNGGGDYYAHTAFGFDWWQQDVPYFDAFGVYSTTLINDWIVKEIEGHNPKKHPLFAYVSHQAPHFPLQVPQQYADLYPNVTGDRKQLLGKVSAMDESVCNLTMALKKKKIFDDTIIIFMSDNGGDVGDFASNLPLRGAKLSLFEGGIRVPTFITGPGIPKGTVNNGLFHATDWLPTLMRMLGGEPDIEWDGVDQTKMLLENGASARNEVVFNIDMHPYSFAGQAAVRRGDFKLIWGNTGLSTGRGNTQLRNRIPETFEELRLDADAALAEILADDIFLNNFLRPVNFVTLTAYAQLVGFRDGDLSNGQVHLFNIKDDPNETRNLADDPAYADKVKELKYMIFNELYRHQVRTPEEDIALSPSEVSEPNSTSPTGRIVRTDFCEGQVITV